jgi:hypothetical protein
MEQSTKQLAERNSGGAAQNQGKAMGSMNRSIMQMQNELGKMQGQGEGQGEGQGQQPGGQGQGFMQQLQQAAMQQQMINQSMQQMMQGQGQQQGGMSQAQREQMGRLAGQQAAVQRSLDELNKEQEKSGKKQALGDLGQIAKEMQEIISDMQSGDISPETLQRQEKILSRLLDASRSTRERDFKKKRKGNSGQNYVRESPENLQEIPKEELLKQLLQSVQQEYSKDYKLLILKYFDALKEEQVK